MFARFSIVILKQLIRSVYVHLLGYTLLIIDKLSIINEMTQEWQKFTCIILKIYFALTYINNII